MSSTNPGTLLCRSGQGPIQASAWENERDGKSMGVTATLTKSFYDRSEDKLKRSSCSMSLPELAAAIAVLQDLQSQLLHRGRELSAESTD